MNDRAGERDSLGLERARGEGRGFEMKVGMVAIKVVIASREREREGERGHACTSGGVRGRGGIEVGIIVEVCVVGVLGGIDIWWICHFCY